MAKRTVLFLVQISLAMKAPCRGDFVPSQDAPAALPLPHFTTTKKSKNWRVTYTAVLLLLGVRTLIGDPREDLC